MTPCPHCGKATIGYFAKHASWSGGPARCTECGGLSYLPSRPTTPGIYGNLIFSLWPIAALGLALITGSVLWSAAIMIAGFALLVIAHETVLRKRPLVAVSEADVRDSRKSALIFAGGLLFAAAIVFGVRLYNAT
jgi:hypothetical protein